MKTFIYVFILDSKLLRDTKKQRPSRISGRPARVLLLFNADGIATGEDNIEDVGWEIFRTILEVASGCKQTWADRLGLHNDWCLFHPVPVT
ncbi:UxaA family hydrolase [Bacillus vallismortis]|nr:UxaA family hydrolase [Bacillus vallismortis]